MDIRLRVNGHSHELAVDPRLMLLDALREVLGSPAPRRGATRANAAPAPC